ncbi:MAG: AsmA family protein, partial [Casimicrobiaceae bacterium]
MPSVRYPKTLAAIAVITVLAVAFVATFDWNWVRAPLAHYLSGKFDRSFAINGDLHGEFSLHPLLTGTDVVLANAAWGSAPALARARQVAVRVDLLSFLHDSPSLPELTLSDATLALERDAQGRENWDFGDRSTTVQIGRLVVDAGAVQFHDLQRGIDLNATVKSAAAGADGQLTIRFDAKGIWEKNDLTMAGTATTPFAANLDDRPYRLDIELHSGTTSGTFAGTFVPAHDKEIEGALALKGQDLSQIDA